MEQPKGNDDNSNLFGNPNEKLHQRELKRRVEKTRSNLLLEQQIQQSKKSTHDSDDEEDFPEQSVLSEHETKPAHIEMTSNEQQSNVPYYLVKDENGDYLEVEAEN
ncbi:hypothetical protein RFI_05874 [Reticulomyxa filosa]|uniref:Uncharacterized protein n=1 Tax=Reticulomyxa filosa TaxID=46433 RepID=X6NZ49_RETFI|nr:hypothetical protein RFI_05874 [Reticulomyxa filosa]|eukprot:ETO31246.1 hypothetical protein RFI_05874 [Reticulomyxa filosa]